MKYPDPMAQLTGSPFSECGDRDLLALVCQDHLFRQVVGTALLTSLVMEEKVPHAMLDIGCGVGGWTLDIACRYPTLLMTGLDRCSRAIAYARAQAQARNVCNVAFTVMDDAQTLRTYADQAFDIITCRLLISSLMLDDWLPLLRECVRVTRLGGIICLIVPERGSCTSPALEEVTALIVLALKLAGNSGSVDGRMIGMAPWLGRLLEKNGCHALKYHSYVLDYRRGTSLANAMCQYLEAARPILEPWLLSLGLTTPTTFHTLYSQALGELRTERFYGLWTYLAVYAMPPFKTTGTKHGGSRRDEQRPRARRDER